MAPDAWLAAGPILLLGILVPMARTARWRTLALLILLCSALVALAPLLPWKAVTTTPLTSGGWTVRRHTESGIESSWRGFLVLSLGLLLSGIAWRVGARPQDRAHMHVAAAAMVVTAFVALGTISIEPYLVRAFDPSVVMYPPHETPTTGLFLAALAATAAAVLSVALLLRLSKARSEPGGDADVDATTLRDVFR